MCGSLRADRWAPQHRFICRIIQPPDSCHKMPKCPNCQKEVYFAEKVTSLGKDWHRPCLRCEKCKKTLSAGSHAEHGGKPYCHNPCYGTLFGPKGFGRGGTESHTFQ